MDESSGSHRLQGGLRTHLRVLYLVPYLNRGGTERHLIDLVRTIQWEQPPSAIAPDGPSRPALEATTARWVRVPTMGVDRSSLTAWRGAFSRAITELEPHLIHAHAGVELLWATRHIASDRPRVFTVHGYHGGGAGLSYRLAAVLGRRLASRVIAVSESEAAQLQGIPRDQLRIVLNGVADPRSSEPPAELPGVPQNAVIVAVASRLEPPKGVDLVVEAFIRLTEAGARVIGSRGGAAEAHLVVMGSGSQEEELRRRITEAGLKGRIHLLGYQPQAAAHLRRADMVVQVSRQDALPLTVAEAMAVGVPAIVSDAGGLPELVQDGVTGRVVPRGTVAPLVEALAQILADPTRREAMGRAARRRYESRFTLERFTAETLQVYREVAGAPSMTLASHRTRRVRPGYEASSDRVLSAPNRSSHEET